MGLIAGSRRLPFVFAGEARRRGQRVAAVGFEGETDPALAAEVDQMTWVRVGQLGKMIDAQSIVVAGVSVSAHGEESKILRFVFWHSLALAALISAWVAAQAYWPVLQATVVH